MTKIGVYALGLVCVLAILFLVAFQSRSTDFSGNWKLDDLTCEELVSGYEFEVEMLQQIIDTYDYCRSYLEFPDTGYSNLHCELLKIEGSFVERMVNALASLYTIKCKSSNETFKKNPEYEIYF